LTLYVCAVHAGPFTVFVEEAHEDSADLLFMPEATAADWAMVFSYAEVLHVGAGLAVVQAGEHDRALYLLTEGAVGVRLPRDEGSFKTMPRPGAKTQVLAVPRSMARSEENRAKLGSMAMNDLGGSMILLDLQSAHLQVPALACRSWVGLAAKICRSPVRGRRNGPERALI